MVVSLTYKQILRKIRFPVHALPSEDFYVQDGLLFIDDLVVDDRNQPGDTIGKRRLQTQHKLKKLSKTYEEFVDIVKENPGTMIDTNGKVFSYEKTEFHTVKSVRIKKKVLKDTHSVLWLEKVNFGFVVKSPPFGKKWAQVLYLDSRPWLLLDFSEEKQKDVKRKI